MGRVGADQHITSHERVAGGKETGVNVLETRLAALPDDRRAAILEDCHLRILLVGGAIWFTRKLELRRGEATVQPQGHDAESVAIRSIVLPYDVAAVGRDAG